MPDTLLTYGNLPPLAHYLSPGAKVAAYVDSSGAATGDFYSIAGNIVTTLNEGLGACRAGSGDIVVVLPGHDEDIASADQMSKLKAGTRVIGAGSGSLRPKLTWTATGSSFLLDVAGAELINLHLVMADTGNGGVSVAAPITVSAADCAIVGCDIDISGDANDLVTIGVTTTAAANNFRFHSNKVIGATAAECTTFLQVVGGDGVEITENFISLATSAVAVGGVRVLTTASTNMKITDNVIFNNKTASEQALTLLANCTGYMDRNLLGVLDNAAVDMGTQGNVILGNDNYIANTVAERGVQMGTVSAAT